MMNRTAVRIYSIATLAVVFALATRIILGISYLRSPTPPPTADSILVIKHTHTMTLLRSGQPIKQYRVALGRGGLAPKQIAGATKSPKAPTASSAATHTALSIELSESAIRHHNKPQPPVPEASIPAATS